MLRLSFIVPFYNVEPYIEECIRSLYNQDIPWEEYEVICIDDCSPDGSRVIVERLQQEYPTLKLLRTPENLRQGGARNMGLDIAQGKYIWFVDSDDYIIPNCLKRMLDLMDAENLEMLKFTFLNQTTQQPHSKYVQYGPCSGSELIFDAPLGERSDQRCCTVCGELILRDLIERCYARFVEKKQYEDDDYMYPLFAAAKRVMSIDVAPYVVRYVEDSTTHAKVTYRKIMDMNDQSRRIINLAPQLTIVDKRWKKLISDYVRWTCLENVLKNLFVFSLADQLRFFFFEGRIMNLRSIVGNRVWLIMNSWLAFRVLYGFNQDINLKKWNFFHKLHNRWTKLRFQPIRVFCFHQVSEIFDESTMWQCDWIQTDIFKQKVTELQKKYTFISLPEAQKHLREDWLRCKHYAVMTADDGFASMKEIVPWLVERNIPITLFINPVVWDGKTIGKNLLSLPIVNRKNGAEGLYLTLEELIELTKSPLVTIGYHGYEHIDEYKETNETFVANFEKCKAVMIVLQNVIPFYAHTYGHTTEENDNYLQSQGITPVYISGGKNYNRWQYLDRELL